MNWQHYKLGMPIAVLNGLMFASGYITLQGEKFSIFDLEQTSRLISIFFAFSINGMVTFLNGLRTKEPWAGEERRREVTVTETVQEKNDGD